MDQRKLNELDINLHKRGVKRKLFDIIDRK